jgi:hypothetical protein
MFKHLRSVDVQFMQALVVYQEIENHNLLILDLTMINLEVKQMLSSR